MPYDIKRMLRLLLGLTIVTFIMWIILEVRSIQDLISHFLYPTIFIIPLALLAVKFKSQLTSRKKTGAGVGVLIGMSLGNIISKSASEEMKHYLLVFSVEFAILCYYIFRTAYNERNQLQHLGLQRISASEFKSLTKSLGFNRFDAWFSPATRDHYTGTFQGLNACVFSFQTNGPAYLAVIFYSDDWQLPVLQVKPKSISVKLKSMFRGNTENKTVKQVLSDDYNIEFNTTSSPQSLTPKLVAEINKSDSIELEATHKALFLYDHKKFSDEPENYENAIQQGHLYASMFADGTFAPIDVSMEKCPTSGISSQAASP